MYWMKVGLMTQMSQCDAAEQYRVQVQHRNSRIIILFPMNKRITEMRLQKEAQSLQREPIPSVLVHRQDLLNFHFCFHGLEEEYSQGFYHGLLELPEDYPFSPPKIKFFTNNGRFEVGKSICTTFTHYHKETWSSTWNIRNILTAMVSFMYSQERGIGGVFETPARRRQLAAKSLAENLQNPTFVEYFRQKLIQSQLVTAERMEELLKKPEGKGKGRRRREKSQSTRAEEAMNTGAEVVPLQQVLVNLIEEESGGLKRERVRETELQQRLQLAQLQMVSKRQKLGEQLDGVEPIVRHKTMQQQQQQS